MRLIDADALTKAHCEGCAKDIQEMCKTDPVCASMMWVVEAPTVDAVEVVHGLWLDKTEVFTKVGFPSFVSERVDCSACGHIFFHSSALTYNYCPNCGAKMDGGNKDEM